MAGGKHTSVRKEMAGSTQNFLVRLPRINSHLVNSWSPKIGGLILWNCGVALVSHPIRWPQGRSDAPNANCQLDANLNQQQLSVFAIILWVLIFQKTSLTFTKNDVKWNALNFAIVTHNFDQTQKNLSEFGRFSAIYLAGCFVIIYWNDRCGFPWFIFCAIAKQICIKLKQISDPRKQYFPNKHLFFSPSQNWIINWIEIFSWLVNVLFRKCAQIWRVSLQQEMNFCWARRC